MAMSYWWETPLFSVKLGILFLECWLGLVPNRVDEKEVPSKILSRFSNSYLGMARRLELDRSRMKEFYFLSFKPQEILLLLQISYFFCETNLRLFWN
ncbi:hypothetical protein CEXT_290081 [Caerostris extrusa]|uniref:Uncharacterized protein n=1 Tax=Caerostris extrusa TaxID=172846 RepID=A0AAV4NIF8_CAEEX|nr:hypothetical protein CEXT_290081 [Caerostris extrusa]